MSEIEAWNSGYFEWLPVANSKAASEAALGDFFEEVKANVKEYNKTHHPISARIRKGIWDASQAGVDYCIVPGIAVSRADELAIEKAGFKISHSTGCEKWIITIDGKEREVCETTVHISWREKRGLYF